jgi:dTMP kinase
MFVSFDGTDGVGKSTQIEMFTQWLGSLGCEYVFCRDPGSTALGDALRDILLQKHDMAIDRRSEMFLYMTARTQLVEEVIKPALAEKKLVVCDRYLLANIVYQGHAGGLDPELVRQVGAVATQEIQPTLTFVLDMDVKVARQRMNRELDRIESQGIEYMQRVRLGFLKEAARYPEDIQVIDANRAINEIQVEIQQIAVKRLNLPSGSI